MIQTAQVIAIDDDVELLRLIAMLLRRAGAQCAIFSHGGAALEHVQQNVPDLILLDLMLPEPNGLDILRTLRRDARLDAVPILILSAKADARTVQEGLALGADGFIAKPYVADHLVERVRAVLAQRRPSQAAGGLVPGDPSP